MSVLEAAYRTHLRRVLATLIRVLERQKPDRFGLMQQSDHESAEADRLARELAAHQLRAARSGIPLVEDQVDHVQHRLLESRRFGAYTLQAAIAAIRAEAPHASETDWTQIVALYDLLVRAEPSPIVLLNRAVAVGMRDGPAAGLEAVEAVLVTGALDDYPFGHSARAELCRRLGRIKDARASCERALRLARQEPERRFLERSMARL